MKCENRKSDGLKVRKLIHEKYTKKKENVIGKVRM